MLLVAAPAAHAGKTKTYAPPGKAGTSEYSEVIPTSGGNVATPSAGAGNTSAAQISRLGSGRAGIRNLARHGSQGKATASFAVATAPTKLLRSASPQSASGKSASRGASDVVGTSVSHGVVGTSVPRAILDLIGGADVGGLGIALPLLLAFGLGGALGFSGRQVWRGRRRSA